MARPAARRRCSSAKRLASVAAALQPPRPAAAAAAAATTARTVAELRTPCLVLDLPVARANIARMQRRANRLGVALRPHVKTHKTIELARMQTGGGCRRITVSTLAEAEFYADSGFDDVLYAVPITPDKLAQAAALTDRMGAFHIIIDHEAQFEGILAAPPPRSGKPWSVWLMVDCGYHRDGVDPADPASLRLAQRMAAAAPTVTLGGIYTHGGHSYASSDRAAVVAVAEAERDVTTDFAEQLRAAGVTVPVVGVGSTPTCSNPPPHLAGVDELHPGNYIFNDTTQQGLHSCEATDIAVRVMTRVIGHYRHSNMLLIDLGWTGCSAQGKEQGYGMLLSPQEVGDRAARGDTLRPTLKVVNLKQEAGEVECAIEGEELDWEAYPIGSMLCLLPYHSCAAVKMHDAMHVVGEDGDTLVGEYKICRGW